MKNEKKTLRDVYYRQPMNASCPKLQVPGTVGQVRSIDSWIRWRWIKSQVPRAIGRVQMRRTMDTIVMIWFTSSWNSWQSTSHQTHGYDGDEQINKFLEQLAEYECTEPRIRFWRSGSQVPRTVDQVRMRRTTNKMLRIWFTSSLSNWPSTRHRFMDTMETNRSQVPRAVGRVRMRRTTNIRWRWTDHKFLEQLAEYECTEPRVYDDDELDELVKTKWWAHLVDLTKRSQRIFAWPVCSTPCIKGEGEVLRVRHGLTHSWRKYKKELLIQALLEECLFAIGGFNYDPTFPRWWFDKENGALIIPGWRQGATIYAPGQRLGYSKPFKTWFRISFNRSNFLGLTWTILWHSTDHRTQLQYIRHLHVLAHW